MRRSRRQRRRPWSRLHAVLPLARRSASGWPSPLTSLERRGVSATGLACCSHTLVAGGGRTIEVVLMSERAY